MPLLRLFPLGSVLFPGGTLPLRIFEARYRLMIGECIDREEPFGVVLIRSGREVGGSAVPFDVGTTARIRHTEHTAEGHLNIVCSGKERFRIVSTDDSRPYLQAEVELLKRTADVTEDGDPAYASVRALFTEYYRLTFAVADQWQDRVGLPRDPERLADFVASRLEAESVTKQELLETDSVRRCLEKEGRLLDRAIELLQLRLRALQNQKYRDFGRTN